MHPVMQRFVPQVWSPALWCHIDLQCVYSFCFSEGFAYLLDFGLAVHSVSECNVLIVDRFVAVFVWLDAFLAFWLLKLCILIWTGLELETQTPVPTKKVPAVPQLGDKYNIKPAVLKRPRYLIIICLAFTHISLTEHVVCCPLLAVWFLILSSVVLLFAALLHQTHRLWRKSTSLLTPPPTQPKKSKSSLFLHNVSYHGHVLCT